MSFFEDPDQSLPEPVKTRLRELNENPDLLQDKVAAINSRCSQSSTSALIRQSFAAGSTTKRLFWLRREAQHMLDAVSDASACRQGCSHCCNIGVMVSASEARVIGKEIGRTPSNPPDGKYVVTSLEEGVDAEIKSQELSSEFFGRRCTFLGSDGHCSIYEHRPMACRNLVNLDRDALLCELVPGGSVPVPYLNRVNANMVYVMTMGIGQVLADIRYFFPGEPRQK